MYPMNIQEITDSEYQDFVNAFQQQCDGLEVLGLRNRMVDKGCIEATRARLMNSWAELDDERSAAFPAATEQTAALDRFSMQWQDIHNEVWWLAEVEPLFVLMGFNKMQKEQDATISARYNLSNDLASMYLDLTMRQFMMLPRVLIAVERHATKQIDLEQVAHVVWSALWEHPHVVWAIPNFHGPRRDRGKMMASVLSVMAARLNTMRHELDDCGMIEVLFRKALRSWVHNEQIASTNALQMAAAQGLVKLFGGMVAGNQ